MQKSNDPPHITGFPPIVNEHCRLVILGTLPGTQALVKQESYGNKHNHFWPILMKLLKGDVNWDYVRRIRWVLKHGIALWDVYQSGERQGALDSAIRNPQLNNFPAFFKIYPNIERVYCNGKESFRAFTKNFSSICSEIHYLPSTSPAMAKTLEWKLQYWKIILDAQND